MERDILVVRPVAVDQWGDVRSTAEIINYIQEALRLHARARIAAEVGDVFEAGVARTEADDFWKLAEVAMKRNRTIMGPPKES